VADILADLVNESQVHSLCYPFRIVFQLSWTLTKFLAEQFAASCL